MIRLVSIFRNIRDMEKVLTLYIQEIFPILHKLPGVICTDVHSVSEVSQEYPQELEGVQLIFETHFESYEIFTKMLQSEEGMQIMKLMEGNDIGDYYIYWTKVRRFNSELKTSIEGYSTVQTVDVIQSIDSVAELASLRLDEQEKKGAMKALEILRKELNLINLQS